MTTYHLLINGDSRKLSLIHDSSVQLIVTSPPYWQLKDYGNERQIGFNDTYEQYINNLNLVWSECYRVLQDGCRLCINIGDQFARSVYYGRYKVIPIHAEVIRFCETIGFDYMGDIIWQKPTTMHTTGGQKVMGSYPYPRGGIVKIDFEHILLFKKPGKVTSASTEVREKSILTDEEWNTYFSSHWNFSGARQDKHIAVFPEELPKRLIKMFSFAGDTVLDPFMGSGTTALASRNLARNSIGYELNRNYRQYYMNKVVNGVDETNCKFEFREDSSFLDMSALISRLPYTFVDVSKFDKQVDVKEKTYGSVFEDKNIPIATQPTVLVNHAKSETRQKMVEKGICYLRAGMSKGSLLVASGFERLQYVLLHTNGEQAQMFKLNNRGHFQIWTKETLEEYSFHPSHASYYVVLQFNKDKPIRFDKLPIIRSGKNTFRARLFQLDDFYIK